MVFKQLLLLALTAWPCLAAPITFQIILQDHASLASLDKPVHDQQSAKNIASDLRSFTYIASAVTQEADSVNFGNAFISAPKVVSSLRNQIIALDSGLQRLQGSDPLKGDDVGTVNDAFKEFANALKPEATKFIEKAPVFKGAVLGQAVSTSFQVLEQNFDSYHFTLGDLTNKIKDIADAYNAASAAIRDVITAYS